MEGNCFGPLPATTALWDQTEGWQDRDRLERWIAAAMPLFSGRPLVFLYAANDVATVVAYLAAVRAGAVVALLDGRRPEAEQGGLLQRYVPERVVGAEGPVPSGYGERVVAGLRLWSRDRSGNLPHPDLCLLLATSGSTGSPKFVRLSRRAVTANAAAIAQVLGLGAGERPLLHLAMHYSYGLSVLNSHLAVGGQPVLTSHPLTSGAAWEICRSQHCTSLPGVPAHYELMRRLAFDELPSLQTLTQAGGKLAPEVATMFHQRMAARGGRLFIMYGQTEASPRMSTLAPERLAAKPGSVGSALPGGRFEIRGADGGPAPPGQPGEIVYHGPNVMMGYAGERADLGLGDQCGGALATGDVGWLDGDGDLFITGRLARFAKLYGVRLSLDDVEARLNPALGRVAAVERDGKVVVHCCGEVAPAAFHAALRGLGLPVPGFVLRRTDELPLTSSGKIDYRRLGEAPGNSCPA
jgi:acyl-CoA synthetase (AMP-forming)/AMP-acid ligase II